MPFGVSFYIYLIKNFFHGRINIILELSVVDQRSQEVPAEHAEPQPRRQDLLRNQPQQKIKVLGLKQLQPAAVFPITQKGRDSNRRWLHALQSNLLLSQELLLGPQRRRPDQPP
jgi:hypothetical protein